MLSKSRYARLVGLVIATLWSCGGVSAHRRDFPFTYDWFQPAQGEKEIELQTRYDRADDSLDQQIEFEYGVNRRFMVAPYLVFGQQSGHGLAYQGFKVETRYQLKDFAISSVLPGLYFEYEKPRDESGEIEGKLILSRYDGAGGDLSLNLIAERPLVSAGRLRTTYSFGYARSLGETRYGLRGGLECVRNIDDGRVNAGPVAAFSPMPRTWLTTGYGFPLNHPGSNKGEFRLLVEYEWF